MISLSRDAAWAERLRRCAKRGGWPFVAGERAAADAGADRIVIVLDHGAADGPLKRAVAGLRARFPEARIVVAFGAAEFGADGALAGLQSGADEVIVKSWADERLFTRLSAVRDAGLAAAVRVSADGGLKAERRSQRVFTLKRGRWAALDVPAAEFALLWELMTANGERVSREHLLGVLRGTAGREVEAETLSRRVLSLRKSVAAWKGGIETVRGGFYRLAAPERFYPGRIGS
jgi:DNA-binding response OmpR family regulator